MNKYSRELEEARSAAYSAKSVAFWSAKSEAAYWSARSACSAAYSSEDTVRSARKSASDSEKELQYQIDSVLKLLTI